MDYAEAVPTENSWNSLSYRRQNTLTNQGNESTETPMNHVEQRHTKAHYQHKTWPHLLQDQAKKYYKIQAHLVDGQFHYRERNLIEIYNLYFVNIT